VAFDDRGDVIDRHEAGDWVRQGIPEPPGQVLVDNRHRRPISPAARFVELTIDHRTSIVSVVDANKPFWLPHRRSETGCSLPLRHGGREVRQEGQMATPNTTATVKAPDRWAWLCGGVEPFPPLIVPPKISAAV